MITVEPEIRRFFCSNLYSDEATGLNTMENDPNVQVTLITATIIG